jgi:hypothetical protein
VVALVAAARRAEVMPPPSAAEVQAAVERQAAPPDAVRSSPGPSQEAEPRVEAAPRAWLEKRGARSAVRSAWADAQMATASVAAVQPWEPAPGELAEPEEPAVPEQPAPQRQPVPASGRLRRRR